MGSLSPGRIALGVVALTAIASVLLAWPLWTPGTTSTDAPRPSPVAFDIADAGTRRALVWLQGGDTGGWLGRQCDSTTVDTFRVAHMRRTSHTNDVREARILAGDVARVEYGDGTASRAASIDSATVARLETMLSLGGYPDEMPPAIEPFDCGSPFAVKIESCREGRYYGVVRACPDATVFPLVAQALDFAQAQVEGRP